MQEVAWEKQYGDVNKDRLAVIFPYYSFYDKLANKMSLVARKPPSKDDTRLTTWSRRDKKALRHSCK